MSCFDVSVFQGLGGILSGFWGVLSAFMGVFVSFLNEALYLAWILNIVFIKTDELFKKLRGSQLFEQKVSAFLTI